MELTKEEISIIDQYISACGIKYYDVKMEIVDHFATILERKLEENPYLDFNKEIENIHNNFSSNGFKILLDHKTKSTYNLFLKLTFNNFKSFFKLPKIIITVCTFLLLYSIMPLFDDKKNFFFVLSGIGFSIILLLGIRMIINLKSQRQKFLILNRTTFFYHIVNNMFLWFQFITSFRSKTSFLNNDYNILHIVVFVLMLLIYWSMEYVYQQNRKEVQKQYPNIAV